MGEEKNVCHLRRHQLLILEFLLIKKTYGNESSNSSDVDFEGGPSPKEREIRSPKATMTSPSSTLADTKYQSGKQKGSRHTSDRDLCEKLKIGGMDTSELHSSGKKKTYRESAIKLNHFWDFRGSTNPSRKISILTVMQMRSWVKN
ncbi:uncharacterized protein [Nicotiana tomentosiformis]|uniref:uncharacterized protein isoform X2 n=1 Tax=Nicotiana tomentosiformis TaxID=4098 RepID=UPI000878AAAA|nr:uncharacterized protein LOC104117384 isoform X2 [Nicotiana tomentosiformis]